VRRAYRRLALKHHPDRGGTDAEFNAITKAYDAALLELSTTRA
jgi:curved DNA-binding protein CbpA